MPGVPASETTAMRAPFFSSWISWRLRSAALCSWLLMVGVVMP